MSTRLVRSKKKLPWRKRLERLANAAFQNGLYIAFVILLGFYLGQRHLYRDVEHWPSTAAFDATSSFVLFPATTDSKRGISYEKPRPLYLYRYFYMVDGKTYEGTRLCPGDDDVDRLQEVMDTKTRKPGESFSLAMKSPEKGALQAYYHPDHPGLAVLIPAPYRSSLLIGGIIVIGVFAALQLFFTFKDRFGSG